MSLRRSLLFVPGSQPRRMEKAATTAADVLLFDLEDAVAPDSKDSARDAVADAVSNLADSAYERAVRINAIGTPWSEDDLSMVIDAGADALMLPKCENPDVVAAVAERLDGRVALLALIETAAGVVNATEISSLAGHDGAACFGHADFCNDMGLADADASRGIVLHARCEVVLRARAADVAAIDNVCLAVRDEQAFRADAELGRQLGFEGKMCIHPTQVDIANAVFSPAEQEVAWAKRVLEAWADAERQGLGVISVDQRMVDAPVVAAQRRVLQRADAAGLLDANGSSAINDRTGSEDG